MDRNDKQSLQFEWTAPSAGTGPVTFRYAGVRVFASYWADQVAGVVQGTLFIQ